MSTNTTHHTNHSDKSILNPIANQALDTAKDLGARAVEAAGEGFDKAQAMTEKTVRKYPLAAVGVAIGSGVALGVWGYRLLNPPKPTLTQRIGDLAIGQAALSMFRRIF
jgi:hypothetical protein